MSDYDADLPSADDNADEDAEQGATAVKVKRTVKALDDKGAVIKDGDSHSYEVEFDYDFPEVGDELTARFESEDAYTRFVSRAFSNLVKQTAGSYILQHGTAQGGDLSADALVTYMSEHKFGARKSGGAGRTMVRKVDAAALADVAFTPEQLEFMRTQMNLKVEVTEEEVTDEAAA